MSKMYSYDVEVVSGDGYSSEHQVDEVTQFETGDQWVTFYTVGGEILAVFAASAVVSIVRGDECDPNPTQDSAA